MPTHYDFGEGELRDLQHAFKKLGIGDDETGLLAPGSRELSLVDAAAELRPGSDVLRENLREKVQKALEYLKVHGDELSEGGAFSAGWLLEKAAKRVLVYRRRMP